MASPILNSTQCCTPCDGIQTVQVPGTPGATGAAGADGNDGANAFTATTAAFTMPANGANVAVLVADTSWMVEGQILFIEVCGWMQVASVVSANQVTLTNLESAGGAYSTNVPPGTNVNAGSKVSPGGMQGQAGGTAYTASGDIEISGGVLPRVGITSARGDLIVNLNNGAAPKNTRLGVGLANMVLHCNPAFPTGLGWTGIDLTGVATVLLGTLPVTIGGTGGTDPASARMGILAAARGANADITSLTGLTTALSPVQGGTGVTALQSFSVYKVGAQTVATGSATKIQYDGENWDAATVFDAAATYRFTPTVAGKYHLTASVEVLDMADKTRVEIHIYRNGVVFACSSRFWNGAGAANHVQAQIDVDVTANGAGDFFDARVWHNHGANRQVSPDATRTFFNGHWCG